MEHYLLIYDEEIYFGKGVESAMVNKEEYVRLVSLLEEQAEVQQRKGFDIVVKRIPDSDQEGELDSRVLHNMQEQAKAMVSAPPMPDLGQMGIQDFPVEMMRSQVGWPNVDITHTEIQTVSRNIKGESGNIPIRIYSPSTGNK